MRFSTLPLAMAIASLSLTGCGSGGKTTSVSPPPPNTANEWTWVNGASVVNQFGTYGTLGTPAPTNVPGARAQAVSWTDASGNLWLFGGVDNVDYFNDLWKYSGGAWTWVSGSNVPNRLGIYGTQGTPAQGNVPGARCSAVTWTDASGNLWLFGGYGYDSNASELGNLNDLWEYSAGEWTWMGGSTTIEQQGVYGILGTPDPSDVPGAREEAISWTDASGNFWLFGGLDYGNVVSGRFNDLWKYSAGEWTWMGGSSADGQSGIYGTQGMAAVGNVPGARGAAVSWIDAAGDLWLFGGYGFAADVASAPGELNDLWKYSAGEWAWMGGSNTTGSSGTYGTQGASAPSNVPGARGIAVSWIDAAGNFWLFGGLGLGSSGSMGSLGDLWEYSAGEWTWISGATTPGPTGIYGEQGMAAPSNAPGGRYGPVSWIDATGSLWLFGGYGQDSTGTEVGSINDLWEYQP